jgi:hypothetical protein
MRKRNKRKSRASTSTDSSSLEAGQTSPEKSVGLSTANNISAGAALPDQDATTLAVANINRFFDADDPSNGPSCIFRMVQPFSAISRGFTATSITDQDDGAATDVSVLDPTTALLPVTVAAQYLEDDVWPILQRLMESGTGSRATASFSEFVRYTSMVHVVYDHLRYILTINYLAFEYDWTKVFPYSGVVPQVIYDLAEDLDATDVGVASRWLPYIRRLEQLVMWPRIVDQIKRQMTPMMTSGPGGRMMIPTPRNNFLQGTDADDIEGRIAELLDYIKVNMHAFSALLTSFIPFNVGAMDPWSMANVGAVDINRESGWWNSGVSTTSTFGDAGDPTIKESTMVTTSSTSDVTTLNALYHTNYPQPTWGEIKNASIFVLHDEAVDDTYALLTKHQIRKITIVDDNGTKLTYDGTDYPDTDGSNLFRYDHFTASRYVSSNNGGITHGKLRSETIGAEIPFTPIKRLMRTEIRYDYNIELMTEIAQQMAGASLRELRSVIKDRVAAGVKSSF